MRQITPADIHACQRGNNMLGMSVPELREMIALTEQRETFAARVTVLAAKQMVAVKLRNCAKE